MALPTTARWGSNAPKAPAAPPAETAPLPVDLIDASILRKRVVLDSGAVILGGRIERLGNEFWTVQSVISEIRDENSRLALSTLPFEIQIREVDPTAVAFVTQFSKLTGDFTKLSATDLKVLALTYQLEKQFNGDRHLNSKPLPIRAKTSSEHSSSAVSDDVCEGNEVPTDRTAKIVPDPENVQNAEKESESAEKEHDEAQKPDVEGCAEQEADGDEEEDEDDIEPDDFERLPLHDLNLGEQGWGIKSHRHREGSETSFSTNNSAKPRSLPPGWYEGEEDDKGWITPENCQQFAAEGCETRSEDDMRHVACATTDFAMQNVLLQIGLRVLNMDGLVVKQVKQFVLKCHGCFKICQDPTKLFCPSCGNATLMRVAKYVHDDGSVSYSKGIKKFNLRGTRYSLALPKQGRGKDDVVLREDQLLMSKHRQHRDKRTDDDGFQTITSNRPRGRNDATPQEIVGMGFSGGGKRNPNARRRPVR